MLAFLGEWSQAIACRVPQGWRHQDGWPGTSVDWDGGQTLLLEGVGTLAGGDLVKLGFLCGGYPGAMAVS